MKVPMVVYPEDDSEEYTTHVELNEYLSEAYINYQLDWGNGHAIIISFEKEVPDEERLIKAVKESLGL